MLLRAEGATKYEIPKGASGQNGASFSSFSLENDEIRLCARVCFLGSPIASSKRAKILTEGTDSVTECLIILGDSLASLDIPSQKVLVRQNTSKKTKNGGESCDWLLKPMGLATRGTTRGATRGATRGTSRGATRGAM